MKLQLNVDYYIENGKYVLTKEYLLKRGFCCKNGCRHCPYKDRVELEANKRKVEKKRQF
jgi:hypothetical protein